VIGAVVDQRPRVGGGVVREHVLVIERDTADGAAAVERDQQMILVDERRAVEVEVAFTPTFAA
jgi:hypothetical protein